jgi:hypothetical protein
LITANQNFEQLARDKTDSELLECGGLIQNKSSINLAAGIGIAVKAQPMLVLPIIFFSEREGIRLSED